MQSVMKPAMFMAVLPVFSLVPVRLSADPPKNGVERAGGLNEELLLLKMKLLKKYVADQYGLLKENNSLSDKRFVTAARAAVLQYFVTTLKSKNNEHIVCFNEKNEIIFSDTHNIQMQGNIKM